MPLAMPPAMTDLLDIWAAHSPLAGHALDQITVDFLLPTGIYIQMDVPREATIQHIKLVSGSGCARAQGAGQDVAASFFFLLLPRCYNRMDS